MSRPKRGETVEIETEKTETEIKEVKLPLNLLKDDISFEIYDPADGAIKEIKASEYVWREVPNSKTQPKDVNVAYLKHTGQYTIYTDNKPDVVLYKNVGIDYMLPSLLHDLIWGKLSLIFDENSKAVYSLPPKSDPFALFKIWQGLTVEKVAKECSYYIEVKREKIPAANYARLVFQMLTEIRFGQLLIKPEHIIHHPNMK